MIGTSIGRYRILAPLGAGGMGEVFLAEDPELDRKVALKLLPASLSQDETARRRLLREARSAAAIDHPYVCKIYEMGQDEGRDYIAMEYVDGETLRDRLVRGALPAAEALRLASEMAEALLKAHRHGIVHRDLKPANVMLTPEGHLKVMDFGLAKRIDAGEIDAEDQTLTAMTQAGEVLGTLAYMSPEQLRGEAVDERSDLFSFGLMLYEMLTGSHPFARAAAPDMLAAILTQPAATLDPALVPQPIRALVGQLLEKDREARPAGVAPLLEALSSEAPAFGGTPRVVAGRSLRAALVMVALLATVLVVLTLVRSLVRAPESPPAQSVEQLKIVEYETQAASLMENFGDSEALRLAIEVSGKISELDPDYAPALAAAALARAMIAWNSRPEPEMLDRAEREAQEAAWLDPQQARAYAALGMVYWLQGLPDTAEQMLERALELGSEDPQVLQLQARVLMDSLGNYWRAAELARQATQIDPDFYPAWFQLGWAQFELERFEEAEALFAKAIELRPDFVAGYLGQGNVRRADGRLPEALASYDKAVEIDASSPLARFFRGLVHHDRGDAELALSDFEQAVNLNPDHPISSHAHLYQALELSILGRQAESEAELKVAERAFKANTEIWIHLKGLAEVAAVRGETDEALAWLRRAVAAGMKSVVQLRLSPGFESLRDDPRYEEIVADVYTNRAADSSQGDDR